MKKVFYCPACGYVGAAEENEDHLCPKCGKSLSTMITGNRGAEGVRSPYQDRPIFLPERNGVASLLRGIAVALYLLAPIGGIVLMFTISFPIGLIPIVSGFLAGTLFLGFGELIQVTQDGFEDLAQQLRDRERD